MIRKDEQENEEKICNQMDVRDAGSRDDVIYGSLWTGQGK